ncbi:histidine phosphatase family protein [Anaerocolumna sp. AGMB13020]|uniref:histidine phosphatase family protein n=1 Tax=Anaerocolumna sp. AGMB13020 TaxID=3081750 RepID=UPI002954C5D7|nr:histidine phosphatase family protein [Anaerocolumna sp. AGMB13020]WOO34867.1 histidine phosphatase family protein [Anaerocolumna sp. AGMB13020]
MTTIYFIRHAQPDFTVQEDAARPLTVKGRADTALVTEYLKDKDILEVLSSPFLRAVDTVKDFAEGIGLSVKTVYDFRERKVDSLWIEDFTAFTKKQWADFDYKLTDGESLREVQERNIKALEDVLLANDGKNIAIGTHGTALSTILNYYDNTYGYEDFDRMRSLMPWVVRMQFEGTKCIDIMKINILQGEI